MMTNQEKTQAVNVIESDVMQMEKYEWIGDILTTEGSGPDSDRWVNFFPDGDSVNFRSEEKAREHAYKYALNAKYATDIQRIAYDIAESNALGTPTHEQVWNTAEALPESTVWIEADEIESIADIYRSAHPLNLDEALLVTPSGFAAASQEEADRIIARIVTSQAEIN